MLEKYIGKEYSDEQFDLIAEVTTADIKFNRIQFHKKTSFSETIKIAAACAGTLAKCG